MSTKITIKREELYNKVWSKPITHIAKEYEISDAAMNKICKKLNVPTPGAGHWSKIRHNKFTRVIPLPPVDNTFKTTYILDTTQVKKNYIKATFMETHKKIKVPAKLTNPHPLVKSTINKYNGNYNPKEEDLFLNVTHQSRARALRIMDATIKALESRQCKVGTNGLREMSIIHDDMSIAFSFYEHKRRVLQEKPLYAWSKYEFIYTGELVLSINDWLDEPFKKRFADTDKLKLEYMLDDFIFNIIRAFEIKKNSRIRWEAKREEERQRQQILIEEENRQKAIIEEQEKKRNEEEERIKQLEMFAIDHNKCIVISDFIKEVEEKYGNNSEVQEQLNNWLKWANEVVQFKDPFNSKAVIAFICKFN